jgi:carboxyl-terminal processing protease
MKSFLKLLIVSIFTALLFANCTSKDAPVTPTPPPTPSSLTLEINNFIWRGMNQWYLWQANVPDLADNRFTNDASKNAFLSGYTPENLFEHLRYQPDNIDRFSWIVDDYVALEQSFQGESAKSEGIDYGLAYVDNTRTKVVGWIWYIIPGSDAEAKGLKRGDVFYAINGTQLTATNYQSLLALENYTLNFADISNGSIVPNGRSVNVTKTVLNENPILINKTFDLAGKKIGYLMYNGFYSSYDSQLNDAFGTLKANGVTDLVLDLRYNSGGSVQSAVRLASMITGQFNEQVLAKQQWNAKIMAKYDAEGFLDRFVNNIDGTQINSLNLSKVYVLTSDRSASASELVINSLKGGSYVNMVQIGDTTTGKNVGSITLYDSKNLYDKEGINNKHKYAMQPLCFFITDKNGNGNYAGGLLPNTVYEERVSKLGILGETTEPLLNRALNSITNLGLPALAVSKNSKSLSTSNTFILKNFKKDSYLKSQMYIEKVPAILLKTINK